MDTNAVTEVFQVAQRAEDLERAGRSHQAAGFRARGELRPAGTPVFWVGSVRLLLERNVPSALIYLRVEDVAVTVEALRADGVEILAEPHVIFRHIDDTLRPAGSTEQMAFLRDSESNRVGLVSHTPAGD